MGNYECEKKENNCFYEKNKSHVLGRLDKSELLKKFAEELGVGETIAKIEKHIGDEGLCIQSLRKCPPVSHCNLLEISNSR